MPSSAEILRVAVQAARAGQKTEARDLLLELVEVDPRNEMAWMWLSGLVDSLEDKIIACENVLTINPANERVRAYLAELQRQNNALVLKKSSDEAIDLFEQARAHAKRHDRKSALELARQVVEKQADHEGAWLLIGRLSLDVEEQIAALERAARINPANQQTASALERARHVRANPLSEAKRLEQMGKREEALKLYERMAAKAKSPQEFDHIYKQIVHLEALQKENIRYVAPTSSITRLTFTWPALYLSLALMQMGLNPFKHLDFYLLLGLPLVAVGSFLLSVAEVRSDHIIWQKVFSEHGDGSSFARWVAAIAGWFFVLIPHVLLVFDSLNRLRNFRIPPMPF